LLATSWYSVAAPSGGSNSPFVIEDWVALCGAVRPEQLEDKTSPRRYCHRLQLPCVAACNAGIKSKASALLEDGAATVLCKQATAIVKFAVVWFTFKYWIVAHTIGTAQSELVIKIQLNLN